MNGGDVLDLVHAAIWAVVFMAGPAALTAMVVGVLVAVCQALTQVQEMSLTFVPKVVAMVIVMMALGYSMGRTISGFSYTVLSRIETGF